MRKTVTTHRLWIWSCLLSISLLVACSNSREEKSGTAQSDPPPGATSSAGKPAPKSPGTVEVDREMQQALHLKIEPLAAATHSAEAPGFGRVLDPTSLITDVNEWTTARAAASASEQELARTKMLQAQSTASVRALQAAEAAAVRDRLVAQGLRDRIELSWGRSVAGRADLAQLTHALSSQERVIVRVDLPAGEGSVIQPHGARLGALTGSGAPLEAEYIGRAPNTDPQLQGRGSLFLTAANPLQLAAGEAVTAFVELAGPSLHGVFLPESAIVRHGEESWVYVQTAGTRFVREPISLETPVSGGWLITQGLRPQEPTVTQGGQMLLSEEFKPEVMVDD